MKLYIEANVCDWCLIYEALQWIALGRVPEFHFSDPNRASNYEIVDYRVDPDIALDGGPNCDLTFTENEFLGAGLKIDYNRYLDGAFSRPDHSAIDHVEWSETQYRLDNVFKRRLESDDEVDRRVAEEYFEKKRHDEANYTYAIEQETVFEPLMDRAKAKLFDALADGLVKARGWPIPDASEDDEDIDYDEIDITPISKRQWTLRGIDWLEGQLIDGSNRYLHVVLDMEQLLSVFPEPIGIENPKTGERFRSSYSMLNSSSFKSNKSNAARGRPLLGGLVFENAVRLEFKRRRDAGELPSKTEASLAEIREYSEKVIGTAVSRTKAQRIFSSLDD